MSNIKEYGSSYEYAVSKATSEGDVKQIVDTAYDKVDTIFDDCGKCIEEKFSKGITELGKSLESLENNPNFKRNEVANEMETYFKNTVKNEITDSYLTSIRSIDENIEEILRLEGNKKIEVDRLKREDQACKDLISEIQEYAVE